MWVTITIKIIQCKPDRLLGPNRAPNPIPDPASHPGNLTNLLTEAKIPTTHSLGSHKNPAV
ncbi:hypothetical protein CP500_013735 [Tychonema bourrellyi FEM_GT703]|uniref:Uncharacterized protein n=1 Tax=Tychonema bourrellyi FEM_GT703 TaxID=2040638 RepID=A0A2G4EZG4_9CYAN|nr:hypothetical protein CP500_013735 [Tychonema bourrellyi FEM_GT703]